MNDKQKRDTDQSPPLLQLVLRVGAFLVFVGEAVLQLLVRERGLVGLGLHELEQHAALLAQHQVVVLQRAEPLAQQHDLGLGRRARLLLARQTRRKPCRTGPEAQRHSRDATQDRNVGARRKPEPN